MELHEALNQVKFDKRLVDWHLKQGSLTKVDLEKYVKSLPDLAAQSMPLTFEDEDDGMNGSGFDHQ